MATRYGFDFEQTDSTSKAVEAIKNGALVICSMGPGFFTKGGHFILAYNVDAEDIAVNDPANKDRTRASIKTFINECRQYFILKKKEVVKKMEDKKVVGKEANDELLAVGFLHSDHTATLDQPATEGMVLNLINALRKELKGEMKI
jgi:ABC-type bacteriocin/lantibiotic exporter with double-glycine peptidase domain